GVVADALSRKSMGSLAHLGADQRPLVREVYQLANLGVRISTSDEGKVMVRNGAESSLVAEVNEKQLVDPALTHMKEALLNNKTLTFSLGGEDGVLQCQGRLCVPDVDNLRGRVMAEAHNSRYSQVKAEHQRPGRLTQLMEIPMWKWEMINMDSVVGLPRTQQKFDSIWVIVDRLTKSAHFLPVKSTDTAEQYAQFFHISIQMGPFAALYGRRCRSPIGWFEVGEVELLGPDLVHQAMEKVKIIQERLKAAQSHQKSYADIRRRKLEFRVDDWVLLRVSPMKGVMRFGKKGKLSPRYVGPYRVTQRIGQVSYRLELPPEMQVRKLRNKEVASVKVLWQSQQVEEATWEAESEMKEKYPHLFEQV
uniref:Tf2-1-like SH3-like domain-containing protein n=1 Tax=Nicotiana tabacum TaxID=4097 RepID=A0A1S4AHC6_TOBAC